MYRSDCSYFPTVLWSDNRSGTSRSRPWCTSQQVLPKGIYRSASELKQMAPTQHDLYWDVFSWSHGQRASASPMGSVLQLVPWTALFRWSLRSLGLFGITEIHEKLRSSVIIYVQKKLLEKVIRKFENKDAWSDLLKINLILKILLIWKIILMMKNNCYYSIMENYSKWWKTIIIILIYIV